MSKTIYLNSYISESFIELTDDCSLIIRNDQGGDCELYINSHKVLINGKDESAEIKCNKGIIRIFINPNISDNYEFSIRIVAFDKRGDKKELEYYTVKYAPMLYDTSDNCKILTYDNDYINNDTCSFMLLRTNPKLTGNIKVVIDSLDNMYLDTFKINKTLSNKKYRKAKISTNSYYSNDIRNVFGDIPSGDLYDIPEIGKQKSPKHDIKEQYNDTYFYGVKNNFDKLYSENFSILAPLWINKKLPDFFVIFRLDDIFDDHDITSKESFNNIIKNGKIIKYYDLRKNSEIGNYLRNMQNEITDYMHSVDITYNNLNFNTWTGISLRNGVITSVNESAYEINSTTNQVEHDAYITLGYERNDLLNPYLINFEFMFNDEENGDNDTFKLKRYIGLYITNNKLFSFFNIDGNIINIDNSDININDIINVNDYIYNYSSYVKNNKFNRYLENTLNDDTKNLIDAHILTSEIVKLELDDNDNYVMHIKINNPLKCGEHLRIIDDINSNLNVSSDISSNDISLNKGKTYWEVVAVNNNKKNESLNNYKNYYNVYNGEIINTIDNGIIMHSNIFVGYNSENKDAFKDDNNLMTNENIIKSQIEQIVNSFNNMTDKTFIISDYNSNTISFLSNKKLKFERITSDLTYNKSDFSTYSANDIVFFDDFYAPLLKIDLSDNITYENNIFYHYAYENTNNRLAQILNFCNIPKLKNVYDECFGFVISNNNYKKIEENALAVALKDDNQYIVSSLVDYDIEYYYDIYNNYTDVCKHKTIKHPYNNNYIINVNINSNNIYQYNNKLQLYNSIKFDFNIAGYLPIKDFNFNVLDSLDDSKYNKTYSDRNFLYKKYDANNNIYLNPLKQYIVKDGLVKVGNKSYYVDNILPINTSIINASSDVILAEYFKDDTGKLFIQEPILKTPFEDISYYNNYSLTVPYVCKWELNGRDIFGHKIKATNVRPDNSTNTSYFLNYTDNDFIGWPAYRYISDADDNFYIYNDINDIIKSDNINMTIHDYIIYDKGNIIQLFKNDKNVNNRFSTLYYNNSNDSLETIIFGKKITIHTNDKLINLSKYNNYSFTIICSPNANLTSNNRLEYIIDEKTEMFTCIYYTEKHNLTISNRDFYNVYNIYDSSGFIDTSSLSFKRFKQDFVFHDILDNKRLPYYNKLSKKDINEFNINNIKDCSLFVSTLNLFSEYDDNLYDNYTYSVKFDSSIFNENNLYGINCHDTSILVSYDKFNINNKNNYHINDRTANKFFKTGYKSYEYIVGNDTSKYKFKTTFNDIKNAACDVFIKGKTLKMYDNALSINAINPNVINYNDINYHYYSYGCNPEFIDILYYNNSKISKIFNHDMCFSNIHIDDIKPIKELYIDKVIINTLYNYNDDKKIKVSDYDITKCYWSDNIFSKLFSADDTNKCILNPGYTIPIQKRMFMGGVGLVINCDIMEITKWQSSINKISNEKTFNDADDTISKSVYRVNIKHALLEHLLENANLINNWPNNKKQNIISFIENVICNIFNINNKNDIKIYRTKKDDLANDNKLIDYSINDKTFEEIDNIKIIPVNNDILEIELPNDDYQYAIKYIIKKYYGNL